MFSKEETCVKSAAENQEPEPITSGHANPGGENQKSNAFNFSKEFEVSNPVLDYIACLADVPRPRLITSVASKLF